MMINNHFLKSLVIFISIFIACTEKILQPTQPPNYSFSLSKSKNILKINDSTKINLQVEPDAKDTFSYIWSSNIGIVRGSEGSANFIAPSLAGEAIIKVKIICKNNFIYTDSIKIVVYKQFVILKADDFVFDYYYTISNRWLKFINYIESINIRAGLGVIGISLESANQEFFQYGQNLAADKCFEFCNHGYNHELNGVNNKGEKYHEFWNTSYEYQKSHLHKTQDLAKEKFNIVLNVFGAPGNAIDHNTLRVIEEAEDIKIWFFGLSESSKYVLPRSGEIEYPTSNPDFQKFINNYDNNKDCYVFQIHPNAWNEDQFENIKNVIEHLIQNDVTFINPSEYVYLATE